MSDLIRKKILYLGWVGQGNIGDEALLQCFKDGLHRYRKGRVAQIDVDVYYPIQKYAIDVRRYDLVVLGGGSIWHLGYWLNLCQISLNQGVPLIAWGTGVDTKFKGTPHQFSESLSVSSELSKPAREIGKRMQWIACRGPYTKALLDYVGIPQSKIVITGDPAIFLDCPSLPPASKHIFISWGTSENNCYGEDDARLFSEVTQVVRGFAGQGYKITIFPAMPSDIEHAAKLAKESAAPGITLIDSAIDWFLFRELMRNASFVLSYKLHPAILAGVCGRPFLSLGYRMKCLDFAWGLAMPALSIPVDEATAKNLIPIILQLEHRSEEFVQKFFDARDDLQPAFAATYEAIFSALGLK